MNEKTTRGKTADLSEFIELAELSSHHRACKVGLALQRCSEPDRVNLEAALEAVARVPPGAILRWAERRGLSVSLTAILHHRNKKCHCPPSLRS